MGAGRADCDGSYVSTNWAGDEPKKKQGDGVYPQVHMGYVEGFGIYAAGNRRGGNLQGVEEEKGELQRMRCNGGGVLL